MTVYQKTMREALEEMSQHLNESNLEKMRKAAGGAKQTLKMKDGSIGMDSFSASAIMQIYDKINDKNKKTFENMMNNGKKADIMKLQKFAMSKVNASYEEFEEEVDLDKLPDMSDALRQVRFGKEEVELDEAKYDLYHKDFSSAMQHAYKMAKKLHGITISPDEISDKVATGPRKPSEGKTNKYRLEGDKGGIQIQVYNKGGSKPFELNMYKEEVDLDEGTKQVLAHGGKGQYKAVRDGGITKIMYKGKVVGTADFDRGADSFFVSMKGVKGQKSFDDAQAMVDYFAKNKITEEVELDEMEMTFGTKRIPAAMKKKGMDKVKTKGLNKDKSSAAYIGKKKTYEENSFDLRRLLDEKLDQDDKPTVNNVVKMLNKASKAHAGQAKDLEKAVSEADDFKPHMMYDPKTGKGYKADTMDDHLRMKKMGYTHDAPQKEEVELDENEGLKNKSEKSGISVGVLKKVYNRGLAAYKTGHRPGTTAPQWAMARVNSFITKGSGTWGGADKDLAKQTEAVDPADIDTSATDDDIKSADKNIMMQMRKAVSLRGQYPVEFLDKKKVKIPQKMAQAVIDKYNKQKKPIDKEKFQAKIAKSYKALMMVVKEQKEETLLDRLNRKILENNNG